jgi:capsular polysaccharide export protein
MKIEEIKRKLVFENPALTCLKNAKSVLLLQGPVGKFFDDLTISLLNRNIEVNRIVFSGGDWFDCKKIKPIEFTGKNEEWAVFLKEHCHKLSIDVMVFFGQSRIYHKVAIEVANSLGISIIVFEEGYFRPGFITMELNGVNGNSRTLDLYEIIENQNLLIEFNAKHKTFKTFYFAFIHYAFIFMLNWKFPNYQHHRPRSFWHYSMHWAKALVRKIFSYRKDLEFKNKLFLSGKPYLFVPLQFEGDAQIKIHSKFSSMNEFIEEIIKSFSSNANANANANTLLIFKQHPHGLGGNNPKKFIDKLAETENICSKVFYLNSGNAESFVKNSKGVITVNSTVGLKAIEYHKPLYALSPSVYFRDEMVFKGSLDEFMKSIEDSSSPETKSSQKFLHELKNLTQVPGCFYSGSHNISCLL